jgi:NADH-quinone oxidoreductase subunit N
MKFFIFNAAIIAKLYEVSFLIILLSVVGSFYYLRFIKILFFEKQTNFLLLTQNSKYHEFTYFLISVALLIIIFGLCNPNYIILYSYKIVLGAFLI